jgi:polyisoprenoid-binding protein YceI
MQLAVLLSLLVAASAGADRVWTVDRDQAFVTVDAAQFSAFSHRLTGGLRELEGGKIHVDLRLPLRSLTTGNASDDRALPRDGELRFDLEGPGAAQDGARDLSGTLTLAGVSRPVRVHLALVRRGPALFGHTLLTVHLRDFGYPLPRGADDEASIELDTALRVERIASARG